MLDKESRKYERLVMAVEKNSGQSGQGTSNAKGGQDYSGVIAVEV